LTTRTVDTVYISSVKSQIRCRQKIHLGRNHTGISTDIERLYFLTSTFAEPIR